MGNPPPRAAITVGELRRDTGKVERIERPCFDRGRRRVEPGENSVAQRRREHGLLVIAAQRLDAAAHRRVGPRGQKQNTFLAEAVEGVERGGAVAGMSERAGMVARLAAPAVGIRDERFEEPHQRAPLLHGAAEIVHGGLVGEFRIGQRPARFAQDAAGDGAQSRADCSIGLQRGLLVGCWFCGAVHG